MRLIHEEFSKSMKDPEVSCGCMEDGAFVSLYVLSSASKVSTLLVKYPEESSPQEPLMIRPR